MLLSTPAIEETQQLYFRHGGVTSSMDAEIDRDKRISDCGLHALQQAKEHYAAGNSVAATRRSLTEAVRMLVKRADSMNARIRADV
jgi:hypothetical protein